MAKQGEARRGQAQQGQQGQQTRGRTDIAQRESRRSATGRSFSENDEQRGREDQDVQGRGAGLDENESSGSRQGNQGQQGGQRQQGGRGQQDQQQGGQSGLSGHGRQHGEHPVSDLEFDFITVLQNKAEAVNAYDKYMRDAEEAGSQECVDFFRRLHEEDTRHAQEARRHLEMIFRGEMAQGRGGGEGGQGGGRQGRNR